MKEKLKQLIVLVSMYTTVGILIYIYGLIGQWYYGHVKHLMSMGEITNPIGQAITGSILFTCTVVVALFVVSAVIGFLYGTWLKAGKLKRQYWEE